ncbi:putative serine threonine protein kinase protein [Rosellinia necatrix]|uniref:Putative serine threonine protein kinase protein n=1 Tax=Rosellinia necatrix TaxID=77044 RepID=A0A1S7UNP6_ROSNE|nr:putative serine threonine protein kinase protein [Rosellinia necatrix]
MNINPAGISEAGAARPRARALTEYFTAEHGFDAEKHIAGAVIYRRRDRRRGPQRIVVKHSPNESGDPDVDSEERILRRLWGAEHIIRLMSIADDRDHRTAEWNQPLNRPRLIPRSLLPWKLGVDEFIYPRIAAFRFFVMEYLSRGTAEELIEKCNERGIVEISEPLLWYFFLCLARGCVAMAYPPNEGNNEPRATVRETMPVPGQAPSLLSHADLHLGNVMFGEYNPRNAQPSCHQVTPILKILAWHMMSNRKSVLFGAPDDESNKAAKHRPEDAQRDNIKWVGELMHQLAVVEMDEVIDDDDRSGTEVTVAGEEEEEEAGFETLASAEFCGGGRFSREFRDLVCLCLAREHERRPLAQDVLDACQRNVARTPNWRHLADEVADLFDAADDGRSSRRRGRRRRDDDAGDRNYRGRRQDDDDNANANDRNYRVRRA